MPQEKEVYTVTQLDNDFFEEYKRLDRLCSDMYSCQDGVRQYLEDMECQFAVGEKVVPNWMRDYRELRGFRKRRNILAHNVNEYQVCRNQDVDSIKGFTRRILRRQDPLALLNLYELRVEEAETSIENKAPIPASPYYGAASNDSPQRNAPRKKKKGGKPKRMILGILLLLTICALVILLSALLEQTPYSTFKWLLP